MRLWPAASLLLAGCQVWQSKSIDCASGNRCPEIRFALGQPDTATNLNLHLDLNAPSDVLLADGKLLVADCNNHRVVNGN